MNEWKRMNAHLEGARQKPVITDQNGREKVRSRRLCRFALALPVLLFAGVASAQYGQYPQGQYPMLDAAANKVVQKYRNSTCDQLWQERGQPRSQREEEAVRFLRENPQMRAAFIDRIAEPVANKMFECGMIP
jgi:hypothetical protein